MCLAREYDTLGNGVLVFRDAVCDVRGVESTVSAIGV